MPCVATHTCSAVCDEVPLCSARVVSPMPARTCAARECRSRDQQRDAPNVHAPLHALHDHPKSNLALDISLHDSRKSPPEPSGKSPRTQRPRRGQVGLFTRPQDSPFRRPRAPARRGPLARLCPCARRWPKAARTTRSSGSPRSRAKRVTTTSGSTCRYAATCCRAGPQWSIAWTTPPSRWFQSPA